MPRLDGEERRLFERLVKATEKMAEDPVIEIESGPPICPHCETLNPMVKMDEKADEGPLAEFLLIPTCKSCGQVFFAVPLQWAMFQNANEAEHEIAVRTGVVNANNQ